MQKVSSFSKRLPRNDSNEKFEKSIGAWPNLSAKTRPSTNHYVRLQTILREHAQRLLSSSVALAACRCFPITQKPRNEVVPNQRSSAFGENARGHHAGWIRTIAAEIGCSVAILIGTSPLLAAGEQEDLSLNRVLAEAAFTPHFPREKDLIARYGNGRTQVQDEGTFHIYYLPESNLWVRCRIDGENKVDKPLTEILVTSVELGEKRFRAKPKIATPHLKGIHVGDDFEKVRAHWGEPLRKHSAKLGRTSATVFEFFPDSLEKGSCLRFFVRDGVVIGFSFSSEE
jgi:hypothetical protein